MRHHIFSGEMMLLLLRGKGVGAGSMGQEGFVVAGNGCDVPGSTELVYVNLCVYACVCVCVCVCVRIRASMRQEKRLRKAQQMRNMRCTRT